MPCSHILYAQAVGMVYYSSCRSRELTIREKQWTLSVHDGPGALS